MNGRENTSQSPVNKIYWDTLKDLNDTDKMKLVVMLTSSVVYKEEPEMPVLTKEERKRDLMSLAGCWKDDPEDAARMEAAIKDGRKNEFMRDINLDD